MAGATPRPLEHGERTILDEALTLLLVRVERERCGKLRRQCSTSSTARPGGGADRAIPRHSRYIPSSIRRVIWTRDGGRCAFVGPDGRCNETAFLEIHHLHPFAAGGATTVDNLALRCRAHNGLEALVYFGENDSHENVGSRRGPK